MLIGSAATAIARPPPPAEVHPAYVVDSHFFNNPSTTDGADTLFDKLPERYPRPTVRHAVQAKLEVSADPATSV